MEPENKPQEKTEVATQEVVNPPQEKKQKKEKKPKQEKKKQEKKPKGKDQKKEQEQKPLQIKNVDYEVDQYGDYHMIASRFISNRTWTKVIQLNDTYKGKEVLVRARVHNIRAKGNSCFIVLREQFSTVQVVAFKSQTISKDMIKYISNISIESIVDITGLVNIPQKPIQGTTQSVELSLLKLFVVNRSVNRLPLQLQDASRKVVGNQFEPNQEEVTNKQQGNKQQEATVSMKNRLNNRIIDLRTPAKQAIFRISSAVCQLFREFLNKNDFIEIHTPKITPGTSQGGANVFKLKYFNKDACLAQSPQLYKQMCIMSDFDRVYQIGPVFRAENSFTHRHMCQFLGLDIEMTIKQHYYQLLDFLGQMFAYIFTGIEQRYQKQLKAINEQFQFEPFKCKVPVVKLTFQEGIQLLKQNGIQWKVNEDLDTATEKKLGQFVRNKYDTDFYMLHRYPIQARPFYTMMCQDDPRFTCSYDFFMRGEEITSGAQRVHDPEILEKRAVQCGIDPETIKDYIASFKYGAFPHGGCGVGLQRVVMLYCGLKNIRNASLFPRDPKRLTP